MIAELKSALLAAMLSLPGPWYAPDKQPETEAERAARLGLIAEAIVQETRTEWLAWAVLVKTFHESRRWAVEVHEGSARGDGGRSICLGQIWDGGEELAGTDLESTRRCIRTAIRHLAYHARRCKVRRIDEGTISVIYAGYGTGHSCSANLSFARTRARMWSRMVAEHGNLGNSPDARAEPHTEASAGGS